MLSMAQQTRRVLSVFVLAMFNVSILLSLRTLPIVAELGLSSIIFLIIIGAFFLFPCAFVSAELATGWQRSGGIYVWYRDWETLLEIGRAHV